MMDKKAQWALVGAAWFLALSVAALGWLAWRGLAGPGAAPLGAAGAVRGGLARCPVTGESVQALSSTPQVDYLGTVYFFSTARDGEGRDARTRFLMDPGAYLKPAGP